MNTFILLLVSFTFTSASQYFSNAKLHPNCLRVEPTPKLTAEFGMHLFAGIRFYIPFGNAKAIDHISKLIFPGKAKGSENTCATVRIKGFKLQIEGHNDHFLTQDCSVVKKGVNHCTINPNSEAPEQQKYGDGIFTIVWTDNKQSMAVVRCTSDGLYNDWYVFSFQPSLNATEKDTILSTVRGVGFHDKMEDTVSPSYQGCELFDPEEDV